MDNDSTVQTLYEKSVAPQPSDPTKRAAIERPDVRVLGPYSYEVCGVITPDGKREDRDFFYYDEVLDVTIRVKRGSRTDGATGAKTRLFHEWGFGILPTVVHDETYGRDDILLPNGEPLTRLQKDQIFYRAMKKDGVRWRSRVKAFLGVRIFGWARD